MARLEEVIAKDFELKGQGRWLKAVEHDSLVIDTKRQLFFWNSRGISGDLYVYLNEIKKFDHSTCINYLKNIDGYTGTFIQEIKDKTETVVYPKLVDVFYENGLTKPIKYWTDRGINKTTISRFKLGTVDWSDGGFFHTIPIYQDGIFKNFQLRRDVPMKQMKHYYTGVGPLLFNSDIMKLTDEIIITEGPTDCIRLIQEGIPAVSHNSGAGNWEASWYKYFIHQKKIYVVYDNDSAGRIGAKNVAKNLGMYRTKIYTFDGFEEKMDVIEFLKENSIQAFLDLVKNKSKYLFELGENNGRTFKGRNHT